MTGRIGPEALCAWCREPLASAVAVARWNGGAGHRSCVKRWRELVEGPDALPSGVQVFYREPRQMVDARRLGIEAGRLGIDPAKLKIAIRRAG
jgi:hypothetical protein